MESVAQYWQHGKTNKNTNRCEVFALGQAAERRSLAAHDSHGQPRVAQGLDRGPLHCAPEKRPHADEGRLTSQVKTRNK